MSRRALVFLKCLLILILLGGIAVIAVNLLMIFRTKDRIVPKERLKDYGADCILVLGAGVRADGTPSHMLTDRLLVGIDLYESGAAPKLLMSGDHGSPDYDEVNTMKDFAAEKGIPREDIFMDHAGFSTYESLIRAREIFGAGRIVIVTQEYHLYRALWIADALGLDAEGVSADLRTYTGQSIRDAREAAARCKDFIVGILQPPPTYLGEKIDLTGSGNITDDKTN